MIASKIGMIYFYFVSPGVVCHETGHALGCIITGAKIIEFVPFRPQRETLGYVAYRWTWGHPIWWNIAAVIISTGPIWFGSIVICGFTMLFPNNNIIIVLQDYFYQSSRFVGLDYYLCIFIASLKMLKSLFYVWRWTSPWLFIYIYGMFCVASEMQLSDIDIKGMWKGIVFIVIFFMLVNLIPFANNLIDYTISSMKPFLFIVQTILSLALLLDFFFLACLYILKIIFGRKNHAR